MDRTLQIVPVLFFLITAGCNEKQSASQESFDIYEGIEFEMPEVIEPVFPEYWVSITDFGAVNDGQTV